MNYKTAADIAKTKFDAHKSYEDTTKEMIKMLDGKPEASYSTIASEIANLNLRNHENLKSYLDHGLRLKTKAKGKMDEAMLTASWSRGLPQRASDAITLKGDVDTLIDAYDIAQNILSKNQSSSLDVNAMKFQQNFRSSNRSRGSFRGNRGNSNRFQFGNRAQNNNASGSSQRGNLNNRGNFRGRGNGAFKKSQPWKMKN